MYAMETAKTSNIGINTIPLSMVIPTYPSTPYTTMMELIAVRRGTTTPLNERVTSRRIRMETRVAIPITRGISVPIHFIFIAVT